MPKKKIPPYRLHKPSGRAVVTLKGKVFYLGQYNSQASWEEYQRIIGEYIANDCKLPPTRSRNEITCEELAVRFLEWAEGYYIDEKGKPTPTFLYCQRAMAPFIRHYGRNGVSEFCPLSLLFIQDKWVGDGIARETVNRWTTIIKQAVRHGVKYGLVDVEVMQALSSVDNLKAGRTTAPEYKKIETVADDVVDRTLPELPPIVRDMVQIQRFGCMRPQDVYNMRACDIDRSRDIWVYRPFKHKTKHKGKDRILAIGPKAQEIILPYIVRKADQPEAFLFSPRDSMKMFREEQRRNRKSKVQPSQADRSKQGDYDYKRAPQEQYSRTSYCRAAARTIERINERIEKERQELIEQGMTEGLPEPIPHWSPNQLRHSGGTEVRDKYGLEYAQAVLGHSNAKTTEIYAEINYEKAAKVMREIG